MTQPPEAWYADPTDPSRLRWWDGRAWTGHTAPVEQPQLSSTYLPAYPAYPAAASAAGVGASRASYRPARGLARASIVLVGLLVLSELVLVAVSVPSYNQVNDVLSSGGDATDVVTPYAAVALLHLPLEIAAYVVTCLWLWRVRVNAEALSPTSSHTRGRGWVWGGWLCPVVSWWFPYQVVRDVARTTGSGRGVGAWWAWFVAWTLLGNLVVSLDAGATLLLLPVVTAVVAIVAAARWVGVVRAVERDQRASAANA